MKAHQSTAFLFACIAAVSAVNAQRLRGGRDAVHDNRRELASCGDLQTGTFEIISQIPDTLGDLDLVFVEMVFQPSFGMCSVSSDITETEDVEMQYAYNQTSSASNCTGTYCYPDWNTPKKQQYVMDSSSLPSNGLKLSTNSDIFGAGITITAYQGAELTTTRRLYTA